VLASQQRLSSIELVSYVVSDTWCLDVSNLRKALRCGSCGRNAIFI